MTVRSFTCHAPDLKRALAFAMQSVERRNTIPVLGTVRITASADGIEVRGTDLDIECAATAEVISATGPIDITMPPRLLADLLRWAEGEVTISRENDLITIRVDDVEATVRELCPVGDWPAMIGTVGTAIEISEARLQKALTATIACISTEETRYYLNGVFLHDKDGLRAVATDGYRMAVYDTGETWPFQGMIVPRKTVAILHRAMKAGSNRTVEVKAAPDPKNSDATLAPKHSANRIEVKGDGWTILSKTIDATFPDYTRVIPQPSQNITAVLIDAALRRFPKSDERSRAVKIDPTTGRMSWKNYDGIEVSMPVQATGDREIGFNMGYLIAFASRAGTIRLETQGPGDPARVLTDDPALLQVLMPMRV